MLFQAEMRLPIDSELLPGQPEERTPEEVIEHLLKSREEVFTTAEANIKSAQGKQKEKRMTENTSKSAHLAWV